MIKTLDELSVGEKGKVYGLKGVLKSRFLQMGLTNGTEIRVETISPFNGPIKISVRGYRLAMRKEEASCIAIKIEEQL